MSQRPYKKIELRFATIIGNIFLVFMIENGCMNKSHQLRHNKMKKNYFTMNLKVLT